MAKKTGRPTAYTHKLAKAICAAIIDGMTLRQVCALPGMPAKSTILRWLQDEDKAEFQAQYVRAREIQAEDMADEILEIADDGRNDWMEQHDRDGNAVGWRENGEAIRRSALRVEARKWLLSKRAPKKYGVPDRDRGPADPTDPDGGKTVVVINGGLPDAPNRD
ncbi:terminase small subunit protein [Burkholderia vietnamiensis]|uniref:terminase small subunit-like protein n=1 Tax=Burkholderia vietnamiensis TaxID=60552 RepID=UPI0026561571|nr:terminase small subunit protein [Burkholderia vietnamiensis]MDN7820626.1 terminase small subunit protein [Burkholderia vietnamiensis]